MRDGNADRRAVVAWFTGALRAVAYQDMTVSGPKSWEVDKVEWTAFACLYPTRPFYSLIIPSGARVVPRDLSEEFRREVQDIWLPDSAYRYNREVALGTIRRMVEDEDHPNLPLAVYASGQCNLGGGRKFPLGVLRYRAVLPPALMVERLRAEMRRR